jgi:Rrf2 family cysteine metabolism transcriptional repressor
MKVSAKAEYACIAMLELALDPGGTQPIRVKTIADAHGIPLRFLTQILLQLKGAGLVASTRGASGGYQLARLPAEIALAEVINVIDLAPAPRLDSAGRVASDAVRVIHNVWAEAQAAERSFLEGISLADLVHQVQQSNAPSYQI